MPSLTGKRGLGELRCAGQRPAKNGLEGHRPTKKESFGEKDGKILLNKFKRFGGIEKNIYLCTVKNASAGLKSALNAKSV